MSERSQVVPTPEGEYFERDRFAGLSFLLGLIAFVALTLCVVGAIVNPHQFSYSWLFAFAFFFTLCVGCFFWTIVHHATDAEWSVVVRRQLENLAALLGVLAILFVPILYIANMYDHGQGTIFAQAGILTMSLFAGLTVTVFSAPCWLGLPCALRGSFATSGPSMSRRSSAMASGWSSGPVASLIR